MQRLTVLILAIAVWAVCPAILSAQDAVTPWPDGELVQFERGPGGYISLTKLVLVLILLWLWISATDWVNTDTQLQEHNSNLWNSLMVFPFVFCMILLWFIPLFIIGYLLLLTAYAVPLMLYVKMRNEELPPHEQVMTRSHIRFWWAMKLRKVGIKIAAELEDEDQGPPLEFEAQGAETARDDAANLLKARQSIGFVHSRELFADAIDFHARGVMLDCGQSGAAVKFDVDGVWHNRPALDRERADLIVAVIKTIANLNIKNRKDRQEGAFRIRYKNLTTNCTINTGGVKTGERIFVSFSQRGPVFKEVTELGMRTKMKEQIQEQLKVENGFVLISAPASQGFTTTFDLVVKLADRFLRNYSTLEDEAANSEKIENVEIATYNKADGETPLTILEGVLRRYPDVLIVRDLFEGDTVNAICDQTKQNRGVIAGINAEDCAEAVARVLMLKNTDPAKFGGALTAVLSQRLIRKLCEGCKEAYKPPPKLLQQLKLPPAQVKAFYRPRQGPPPEGEPEICPKCHGVGYRGRTAIFELLVVDDQFRQVTAQRPKVDVLRQAARKAGMRTLQEEGIVLVAKGVTSLNELQRVLKASG